jgi:membrane protein DedA with SNARE-associated domain
MWPYILVFTSSFLVDLLPFFGPPAWTVMVYLQIKYGLNIWLVLVAGVSGSTLGRYMLYLYIPYLSEKLIKTQKNKDIQFIGNKLNNNGWRVQLFVLLYTLLPLPSTPLFTASGMARIKAINVIPAFLAGKFTSDMIMVFTGDYFARNAVAISNGFVNWKTVSGSMVGMVLIAVFLFIDWRLLLQEKKLRLNFNIWK